MWPATSWRSRTGRRSRPTLVVHGPIDQNHRCLKYVSQSSRSHTRCGMRIRSHTGHMLTWLCMCGPRLRYSPACRMRLRMYDVFFFGAAIKRMPLNKSAMGAESDGFGVSCGTGAASAHSNAGCGSDGGNRHRSSATGPKIAGEICCVRAVRRDESCRSTSIPPAVAQLQSSERGRHIVRSYSYPQPSVIFLHP